MDEGYCIFAKSAGLTPQQEQALGDAFNSTMNTIFPRTGDSVLSCIPGRNDAFFARNTLRTDILGRKTIFTHTYVLPTLEYARIMDEEPLTILSVPMTQMLDSQGTGAQMEQVELPARENSRELLDQLFQKYDLTPGRYGRLLLGAYEAMTSNGSLRLKTVLPLEKSEELVRELTYCILDGLLPALKGRISFSSGADTRMNISVMPQGDDYAQSGDIIFGVESDNITNIRPKDEISAMAFEALGRAGHEERREMLSKMQNWLAEVTNLEEGLSVMLVSVAYCLACGNDLTPESLLTLFKSIRTAGRGFSPYVINSLLTDLVRRLNDMGRVSTGALSQIAGWYLMDSSPAFRAEADRSFAAASTEVCAALIEAVFGQETVTDNASQMLMTLLPRVPADSDFLAPDIQSKVVLWILAGDIQAFTDYARVLMENYNGAQMRQLARDILQSSSERALSVSEDTMLSLALSRTIPAGMPLSEEEVAVLDRHSETCSEELSRQVLNYFYKFRLSGLSAEEAVQLLENLHDHRPVLFQRIQATATVRNPVLWEQYQSKYCFFDGMTATDILHACKEYNVFGNPGGPFEQEAGKRFVTLLRGQLATYSDKEVQMHYLSDVVVSRWLKATRELNLSQDMKLQIRDMMSEAFWDTVTFDLIYSNEYDLDEDLMYTEDKLKLFLAKSCLGIRRDPSNSKPFIRSIQRDDISDATKNAVKKAAGQMVFILLKDNRVLCWDLVLLAAWTVTEKGPTVDTEKFIEQCRNLDKYFKQQPRQYRKEASDSTLLQDEKLAKLIMKLGGDLPKCLQELIEQLKPAKRGLFGGKKDKSSRIPDPFDDDPPSGRKR